MRVAFLHPDLGLGGAERLIVDAATELKARGHAVALFTARYDPDRAFQDIDRAELEVRLAGSWLPSHLRGRLRAPLGIGRMAACVRALTRDPEPPDVVICDGVAHVIPMLRRRLPRLPVIFYCHYPDLLLTPARSGAYRWYRAPLDAAERRGMQAADLVLVNSHFTAEATARAFPSLAPARVLHPGVHTTRWRPRAGGQPPRSTVACVARFERIKNSMLVVEAYARMLALLPAGLEAPSLVLAGGFDRRLPECWATRAAIEDRVAALGIASRVRLTLSPTDEELQATVADALCVVYPPLEEHFGYVPLEAMACGRPVIAINRGGPTETVIDGQTGRLVSPDRDAVAQALANMVTRPEAADAMGAAGRAHVVSRFSRSAFGQQLDHFVTALVNGHLLTGNPAPAP